MALLTVDRENGIDVTNYSAVILPSMLAVPPVSYTGGKTEISIYQPGQPNGALKVLVVTQDISTVNAALAEGGPAGSDNVLAQGETTLVLGVSPAVAVSGLTTSGRVILSRKSSNSSTATGNLELALSAGSFVVTSKLAGTPATTVTADVSIVSYIVTAL
jgi:hypothetical protein